MRVITSDHFVRWANGTGLIALGGLAWAVFAPGGPLWTALLAAGLVSAALATAAFVRRRPHPIPAEVVVIVESGEQARRHRPSDGGMY
jgi:hypothetical protein